MSVYGQDFSGVHVRNLQDIRANSPRGVIEALRNGRYDRLTSPEGYIKALESAFAVAAAPNVKALANCYYPYGFLGWDDYTKKQRYGMLVILSDEGYLRFDLVSVGKLENKVTREELKSLRTQPVAEIANGSLLYRHPSQSAPNAELRQYGDLLLYKSYSILGAFKIKSKQRIPAAILKRY